MSKTQLSEFQPHKKKHFVPDIATKIWKQSAMPKKLKTVDQVLTEKDINIQ